MKKSRVLAILLLVLALLVSMTACGGEKDSGKDAGKAEKTDKKEEAVPEGTYDVGDFTLVIPDGWTAIPVPLIAGDDELSTGAIYVWKDAKTLDEVETGSGYGMKIVCDRWGVVAPDKADWGDSAEDLDTGSWDGLAGCKWTGFRGAYIATLEILTGSSDNAKMLVEIHCSPGAEPKPKITYTDKEIMDIVGSVKLK